MTCGGLGQMRAERSFRVRVSDMYCRGSRVCACVLAVESRLCVVCLPQKCNIFVLSVSVRFLCDLNSTVKSLFKMIKRGQRRFQVNRKNGGEMMNKFEFHTNVAFFFCSRVN